MAFFSNSWLSYVSNISTNSINENNPLPIYLFPTYLIINDYRGNWYDGYQQQVNIPFHRVYANSSRIIIENKLDLSVVEKWLRNQQIPMFIDYDIEWFERMDKNLAFIGQSPKKKESYYDPSEAIHYLDFKTLNHPYVGYY